MKPENTNPPYLLPDNEPVHCSFLFRDDAPVFWGRCEQWATESLGEHGEVVRFRQWLDEHPKRTIGLYPGPVYLCDTHLEVMRELS